MAARATGTAGSTGPAGSARAQAQGDRPAQGQDAGSVGRAQDEGPAQDQDAGSVRAQDAGSVRAQDAGSAHVQDDGEPGVGSVRAGKAQESGAAVPAAERADGADGEPDPAGDPESEADIVVRDAISAPDVDGVPRRATRRFPLFTRDTARPEGGGRAAPRDAPAPARQWPVLAVSAAVGLGLLLTALDSFRVGTLLIGLALLAGAVLRWLVPDVGMLAVRSRFTDIATYGVLGTAIVLLAMMVQPNPWLVIPFLKDTLHFTVTNS
ncbi:DUF3017 family protein [Streptomyces sp. BK205]|nr:DUF3017 family protein [Streptomyces sp. BK205]